MTLIVQRCLRALIGFALCCGPFLLTGCSQDDAAAANVAAAALKSRVDLALNAHADLLAYAKVEEQESEQALVSKAVRTALATPDRAAWVADEASIRRTLRPDARASVRDAFLSNSKEVRDAVANLQAAAADFEQAWPLGTERFVCVKQGVFQLTRNLRKVAVSFDRNNARYIKLVAPTAPALERYQNAIRRGDEVAATTEFQAFRELLRSEERRNEEVQAAYVQAAQASAEMYEAIEAVGNVSLVDVLKIVQRYAPGLSRLDDGIDGEAISRRAGVTLGKVESTDWLKRFASGGIPGAAIPCKGST